MKEKIERFSKGDFDYELPFLCLSVEEIKIAAEAGKKLSGSFIISNSMGRPMKGYIYSSHRMMQLPQVSFQGTEITISYELDATFLREGDIIDGELCIVSDCGEKMLPFSVQIKNYYYTTSMGKIKDLFQFTNLARADWSEAKRIFRSEDFERVILGNEDRYRFIYRSLMKGLSTSQALEEFLIAIRKKSAISLTIDREQLEYQVTDTAISDKLILTKSNWGFAEIKVSTDVAFVQLEQKFLWADRFTGNTHQISFTIQPKELHRGNHYGHIFIRTPQQTITVGVTCRCNALEQKNVIVKQHRLWSDLTENYLNLRINRIQQAEYQQKAKELMKQLPGPEINRYKELMLIHLSIISGKTKIAKELLEDLSFDALGLRQRSPLEYCILLYLKVLFEKDETLRLNATETLREYLEQGKPDWRLLWLLLNVDKRYENNKSLRLTDIKQQFSSGCRSPVLYYEAMCIYNEDPLLMRELNSFEIQVMNYGIKNDLLRKETVQQYVYLSNKSKKFHPVIFRCLEKLYEDTATTEVLTAICCMLIKGLKRSERYFKWYQLGVEAQLRITELYEYYMYSIDVNRQEPIAQQVLLYFIYNSNISDKKKAYLYASVVRHKEKNETIYRSYHKRMELFAMKMLEGHYISKDLAVLYQEFSGKNTYNSEATKLLPYVMYRNELVCHNPNICNVIVKHQELAIEENVLLNNHMAMIDIFTSNAVVILVDSFGNRFVETVDYSLTPYMNPEQLDEHCVQHSNHPKLLLHLFDRYQKHRIMNLKAINLRKEVLTLEGLAKEYVNICCQAFVDYYYENYDDELLEYYLGLMNLYEIRPSERSKYLEIMVTRAYYDKALPALETFGVEGISINRLVKMCSGWILRPEGNVKNEFMIFLCYYVYLHKKYDDAILNYLIRYYNGATREMYKLWKAAREFELDTHDLEERLLTQMLFTESYIEDSFLVFDAYYKAVTNHLLVKAFLTYFGYQYLIHDVVIHEQMFQIMKRELYYEPNDICLLAWLKYHAGETELSENEKTYAEFNIQSFVRKGMILPFFQDYSKKLSLPDRLLDRTFITYRCDPRSQVYLHYRLLDSDQQEYITERLPNMFMGLHLKEMILFYHETVQYYITEETINGENITESFHITYEGEVTSEEDSKFSEINLILMAKELKEDNTFQEMLENYARKEYMIASCFKPID